MIDWVGRLLVGAAALIVPGERRSDWLAEWSAEAWYVRRYGSSGCALWFCCGAIRDAVWLRRNRPKREWLESPGRCLASLGALAAVATIVFFGAHIPLKPYVLSGELMVLGSALLLMLPTRTFSLGEFPTARSSRARARRFQRWAFLASKVVLVVPLAFFGTFDLGVLLSATAVQPHAAIVMYVIAFRWALSDQRRRCPVCLRLLKPSVKIGDCSHNFLEWYGTELFCARGHGLLHVPEMPTTYSTQRWSDLDSSWSVLFS